MESPNTLTLHGKLCRLRPVMPDDLEFLYSLSTCEQNGFRWRYRGVFPDPSSFARDYDEPGQDGRTAVRADNDAAPVSLAR